jgi:hypothetical protein
MEQCSLKETRTERFEKNVNNILNAKITFA